MMFEVFRPAGLGIGNEGSLVGIPSFQIEPAVADARFVVEYSISLCNACEFRPIHILMVVRARLWFLRKH
jgi:hypothetical protein